MLSQIHSHNAKYKLWQSFDNSNNNNNNNNNNDNDKGKVSAEWSHTIFHKQTIPQLL